MGTLALPLRLEQPEKWPFDLIVTDALGNMIIHQRRDCHSSKDQTVAEAIECVHFRRDVRAAAAAANRVQIDRLEALVVAANSHDALLAALKDAVEQLEFWGGDTTEANAALAKAEAQS